MMLIEMGYRELHGRPSLAELLPTPRGARPRRSSRQS